MEKRKIIAIVGPTASGKTGWGVSIASAIGRPAYGWKDGLPASPSAKRWPAGEIISADSRQVYRGLDIGTGKDIKEYGDIKHHLIDICDPGDKFTMFDWLERARTAIKEIFSRGKLPIIVGGTGLYVQALTEGFELEKSKILNLKSKKYFREELEKKTLKQLQKIHSQHSFLNPHLDLQNPHRLIRAIERAQAGETTMKKKPDFKVLQIAVDLPREELYKRIDQRVENWFDAGFTREVQGLLDGGVDPKWLEKIGLEYRILTEYLIKNPKLKIQMSNEAQNPNEKFENMKQEIKYAIHAYARRQLTWFRRFPEIVWCSDLKSAEKEIRKFLAG